MANDIPQLRTPGVIAAELGGHLSPAFYTSCANEMSNQSAAPVVYAFSAVTP